MKFQIAFTLVVTLNVAAFAQQTPQQIADAELPSLLAIYKDLHTHPELSTKEERSAGIVAKELKAVGCEVTEKVGKYDKPGATCYGVIGVMKNGDGPTVAIRTDLDGDARVRTRHSHVELHRHCARPRQAEG
jgi:metal-dependent amidase/aminoacylase/carboxypeptidase family protein